MILPKADPEAAVKGLRQLRKKFSMGGNEEKLAIVDQAISCINRMQMREAELEERNAELEAQYYGTRRSESGEAEHLAD